MEEGLKFLATLLCPLDPSNLDEYYCQEPWEKFLCSFARCISGFGNPAEERLKTIEAHRAFQRESFDYSYSNFSSYFDGEDILAESFSRSFDAHVSDLSLLLDDDTSIVIVDHLIEKLADNRGNDAEILSELLEYIRKLNWADEAHYMGHALRPVLPELRSLNTANSIVLANFISGEIGEDTKDEWSAFIIEQLRLRNRPVSAQDLFLDAIKIHEIPPENRNSLQHSLIHSLNQLQRKSPPQIESSTRGYVLSKLSAPAKKATTKSVHTPKKRGAKSIWGAFILKRLRARNRPMSYQELTAEAIAIHKIPEAGLKSAKASILNSAYRLRTIHGSIVTLGRPGVQGKLVVLTKWVEESGELKPEYAKAFKSIMGGKAARVDMASIPANPYPDDD